MSAKNSLEILVCTIFEVSSVSLYSRQARNNTRLVLLTRVFWINNIFALPPSGVITQKREKYF